MMREEVAALLKLNRSLYKNSPNPMTEEQMQDALLVWCFHFEKYPTEVVQQAFMRATAHSKFPLVPADIMEQLQQMALEAEPGSEDKWQSIKAAAKEAARLMPYRDNPLVVGIDANCRAIRDDGSQQLMHIFEQLPADVRLYLGSVSGLEDLARCSEADMDTYRRAEWRKFSENHKPDPAQVLGGGLNILTQRERKEIRLHREE